MRSVFVICLGLGFMIAAFGCASNAVIAAAGVTAGFGLAQGQAEAFINGELKAARLVSLNDAERATLSALHELRVETKVHRHSAHSTYLMAKAEHGPEFKIHLKEKSPIVTKIEVRIGVMGDQAVSRLVLARIDHQLGIQHPVVPVEQSPIVAPPAAAVAPSIEAPPAEE